MLIESSVYLSKIFKIPFAFYAKFNVKHLPKFIQSNARFKAVQNLFDVLA